MFYVIESSILYYANDNIMSTIRNEVDELVDCHESDYSHIMAWFKMSRLDAREYTFQCIAVRKESEYSTFQRLGQIVLSSSCCVKIPEDKNILTYPYHII